MEFLTIHLVLGVDSEKHIFFRVEYDGKVLTFSEMYDYYDLTLVSVVPINASPSSWQGVGIFSRKIES